MEQKYNLKKQNVRTYVYFNPSKIHEIDEIKTFIEYEDDIYFPDAFNPIDNYDNLKEYIYRNIIYSNFLCKNLNSDYIYMVSFNEAHAIIVVTSENGNILPNGNIFGFALLQFNDPQDYIYVDVLCSHSGIKYAGEYLIHSIEHLCNITFIETIKLYSVPSAIPFYLKYGFKQVDDCPKNLCQMNKVMLFEGGKYKKHNKNKSTLKRKHNKNKSALKRKNKINNYSKKKKIKK